MDGEAATPKKPIQLFIKTKSVCLAGDKSALKS